VRIIAGEFKGRQLKGPGRATLRPTSDRLRETLFNVLGESVAGTRFLDAFAGTGAVGLEALSRGAAWVTFVEVDRQALHALDANIATLGVADSCQVVRADFLGAPGDRHDRRGAGRRAHRAGGIGRGDPFDLLFLDPPYDIPDLAPVLSRAGARAAPAALLVLEHGSRRQAPETAGDLFRRFRLLEAGDSALSFYRAV
jgi:16S rRNA (guanine(966)-N(2))-methyltransferase RsmD